MAGDVAMPEMYEEFAEWWPLLSAPADYEEEAAFYGNALTAAAAGPIRTLLERQHVLIRAP